MKFCLNSKEKIHNILPIYIPNLFSIKKSWKKKILKKIFMIKYIHLIKFWTYEEIQQLKI
jgi:hypothetical protein